MNGRVYDPLLARFLSPDPYVQAPDYSQNLNRYSYCLNNPLIYTDPSGEFIFTLAALLIPGGQVFLPAAIAADFGGIMNVIDHWDNIKSAGKGNAWKGVGKAFAYYGVGSGQAAALYYGGPIGSVASTYAGDALNSLVTDGDFSKFDAGVTTQKVFTQLAFAPLGNKAGDIVGKGLENIGASKLVTNLGNQIVSQNVTNLSSSIALSSSNTGSIEKGFRKGWDQYTGNGKWYKSGWFKSSLSGISSGVQSTYDPNLRRFEPYKKRVKSDMDFRNDLTNRLRTNIELAQMPRWQRFQLIQYSFTIRINVSIRFFVIDKVPRTMYPELYRHMD